MVVAAVRFQVRVTGTESPVGPATDRVLAGFRRAGSDRGRGQVAGVRWSQADAAATVAATGGADIAGLRDGAIIAVASDAMLRVSELAAAKARCCFSEPRRSPAWMLGAPPPAPIHPSSPRRCFSASTGAAHRAGQSRLARSGASSRLAARLLAVEGRISGHSLRVGAAQSLAAAGAGLVEMQQAGRWQSPTMPARYAAGELAARGAVSRLRYGGGQ